MDKQEPLCTFFCIVGQSVYNTLLTVGGMSSREGGVSGEVEPVLVEIERAYSGRERRHGNAHACGCALRPGDAAIRLAQGCFDLSPLCRVPSARGGLSFLREGVRLHSQNCLLGHDYAAFDDVLQLADVAGPVPTHQSLHRRLRDRLYPLTHLPGALLHEVTDEQR